MKKKRWKVKTHACVEFRPDVFPMKPTLYSCVKCGRIKNWRDVFPVGR